MAIDMEPRYAERVGRYVTALRNGKPDRVPIRPFVAEFTAKYAGYSCQEVTHDYQKAFAAARKCAADFDWDAVVANMVYVWTGLSEAMNLRYYAAPGIHIPPDMAFQYLEPSAENAHMRADEYDQLIEDPTRFLFDVWFPRVARDVSPMGSPTSYRNNLTFLKGGIAMMNYFGAFPGQIDALRRESGTASAIAGILKAPLDIIADKLRGYIGLTMDLLEQPEKVLAACEALAPHLYHVASTSADPDKRVPIGFWMHRGCVPFISRQTFDTVYWPTLRPIIENLWANGQQTLFYAEGKWDAHLETFAELPDKSIVFHVDRDDVFRAHKVFGKKFCITGGIPNYLLTVGTPGEVSDCCKRVIDGVAGDGGYVMDASAIIQQDAKIENVRAMTDTTREHGVYGGSPDPMPDLAPAPGFVPAPLPSCEGAAPGAAVPWAEKLKELPPILGDEALARRIWEESDVFAYVFIWQCLLSF